MRAEASRHLPSRVVRMLTPRRGVQLTGTLDSNTSSFVLDCRERRPVSYIAGYMHAPARAHVHREGKSPSTRRWSQHVRTYTHKAARRFLCLPIPRTPARGHKSLSRAPRTGGLHVLIFPRLPSHVPTSSAAGPTRCRHRVLRVQKPSNSTVNRRRDRGGELLAWGDGRQGQLELGAALHQQQPACAGGPELFGNQRIRQVPPGGGGRGRGGPVYPCGEGDDVWASATRRSRGG